MMTRQNSAAKSGGSTPPPRPGNMTAITSALVAATANVAVVSFVLVKNIAVSTPTASAAAVVEPVRTVKSFAAMVAELIHADGTSIPTDGERDKLLRLAISPTPRWLSRARSNFRPLASRLRRVPTLNPSCAAAWACVRSWPGGSKARSENDIAPRADRAPGAARPRDPPEPRRLENPSSVSPSLSARRPSCVPNFDWPQGPRGRPPGATRHQEPLLRWIEPARRTRTRNVA